MLRLEPEPRVVQTNLQSLCRSQHAVKSYGHNGGKLKVIVFDSEGYDGEKCFNGQRWRSMGHFPLFPKLKEASNFQKVFPCA